MEIQCSLDTAFSPAFVKKLSDLKNEKGQIYYSSLHSSIWFAVIYTIVGLLIYIFFFVSKMGV